MGGAIPGRRGRATRMDMDPWTMERPVKFPSDLEILESSTHGRGLFSKRDFGPGTEVLVSQPFVHVVSSSSRGSVCDQCLSGTESLLKCSQCKHVYYCGKGCQKKDWSEHKAECKSLVSIHPHSPSDTMRLVLRVLQRKKVKLKKKGKSSTSQEERAVSARGREIDFLCSNKDSLSEEVKAEMATQIIGVNKLMSGDPDYRSEDGYEILCKVICNTFSILDWSMNTVAAGLYLLPSLLNHSCAPNCVLVYNGPQLSVRTIKDIKSGDQLFISYTELLETKERRRSHLTRVYSFQCSCERCHGEDEVASGLLAAAQDDIPATQLSKTIEEGLLKLDEDIHSKKKAQDWQGVLDCCQLLISRYKALLGPLNIVMIKLHQEVLEARLELQQWAEALETAEILLKPYQNHLLKYHPTLAVHLMKMAKLRRVIATTEQLQLSIRDLSQVLEILKVCHGEHHPLTDEVVLLIHDSQGELARRQPRS